MSPQSLNALDLITPDGDRVWVVSGLDDGGFIHAWPIEDYVEDRHPSKRIPNDRKRFAPLTRINASEYEHQRFISDYIARQQRSEMQELCFGISEPSDPNDWIGMKVYPYGFSKGEHIVRHYDRLLRTLTVDPVRARNREHYQVVDAWEVLASWHTPFDKPVWRTKRNELRRDVERDVCHHVYRLYDSAGQLLYVGITNDLFRRWKEHSQTKSWWSEVHTFTHDLHADRQSAETSERHLIKSQRPLYNIVHAQAVN